MLLLRELWISEPILTTVCAVMGLVVVLMLRDVVNSLRPKQQPVPYNWE